MEAGFFHRFHVTHQLNELLLKRISLASGPFVGERARTSSSSFCLSSGMGLPGASVDFRHRSAALSAPVLRRYNQLDGGPSRERVHAGSMMSPGPGQVFFALQDFLTPAGRRACGGHVLDPSSGFGIEARRLGTACCRNPLSGQEHGKGLANLSEKRSTCTWQDAVAYLDIYRPICIVVNSYSCMYAFMHLCTHACIFYECMFV